MNNHFKHSRTRLPYGGALEVPPVARGIAVATFGVLLFTTLTFVGANIRIPLQPVPITLQTLFVLLSGAALGSRLGSASQLFYVGLGAVGLPIFAGSLSGFGVLIGPTGGYLLGFLIAPMFVGHFINRWDSFLGNILVFLFGSLIILCLGLLHLTIFYTHDVIASLKVGYFPFIPGDVLKIVAATSIYRSYRGLRQAFPRT
jgi:biotin transport system substrate-specific component